MNNGQVFEAFNLAALWSLPVLYIIENNMYGMGTAVDRAAAGSDLYKRGEAFGIKGNIVDGMNVFKVIDAAQKAGDFVREGNGPYILEVQTYRYRGHSMSDPAKYRSKEELENYKLNDPIEIASQEIIKILLEKNAKIKIFDPHFTTQVFGLNTEKSISDALSESDAVILITGHKEFQNLDLKKFSKTMKNPVLVDCTGLVNPSDAKESGLIFRGIGRGGI